MRYHPFKVYNSVVLSIFTRLFNYHVKFQNIFITPERNPVPINSCSPFSTPFSPLQPLVCSSSEYLSILGILYKWLFVSVFFHLAGEGNGTPLQYSCLENPMGGGAWWAAVHEVVKSLTQLSDFTFTFHFHALEKEMATHSSILAWRIPGTEEPGGLPSLGSHRVRQD